MSSYADCVNAAVKAGKVTRDIGDQILNAADPEAAIDNVMVNLARQKREAAIQSVRMAEAWNDMTTHPGSVYEGFAALFGKDPSGKAKYGNIDYDGQVIAAKYHSKLADALSRFRTRSLGFSQDQEGLQKMIRAIYGESVGDVEIEGFAKDWANTTELMRNEFNRFGGSISKNEKWLLPQAHDAKAIEGAGLDTWKSRIRPMLDRDQMLDDVGNRMTDDNFESALDYVYETITTGGLNKTNDFTVPRLGKKLSRTGSEKRFMFFKDADSWMAYQKEFGKSDIFTTLTDYVNTRSQDIAVMKRLGTSPQATYDALSAQVEKTKKMTGLQKTRLNALFKITTGKINQGELTTVADFMQSTKNVLVAAKLGKAFLSAVSDEGFTAITANYRNIPALKVIAKKMSLMNPANEADRIFAVKLGLSAENWLSRAHGSDRYADIYGTGLTTKVAEGVMRASLLQPWTDAGRKAFGMEYSSMLADNFGRAFGDLDWKTKRAFDEYNISSSDWDLFRGQTPLNHKGAKYADMTQPGGEKFHRMVLTETDFAVPTPDANVKAITTGGIDRATASGQAWRAAMMLKSFPLTVITSHFYRAAYQATLGGKIAYAGTLLASTSILGGVALQAKDLAAGRKPRPMDSSFLPASVLQGGGLGIFGDFLFSDVNRFGGGITKTITGPMGATIDDVFKLTIGNIQQAVRGEETNILGESAKFIDNYTPDIWQIATMKSALADQIQIMADPSSNKRFNRIIRKRRKDFKQDYWWKPGKTAPEFLR